MEIQKATKHTHTEEEIVQLLENQDERVIKLIYEEYAHILFNIIYRIVKNEEIAQDVFQEALLKIWRKGSLYQPQKGSLFTWVVSICKNAAIDKTRSRDFKQSQRAQQRESLDKYEYQQETQSPHNEEDAHLKEVLNQLPDQYKLLIDMSFFQGYTHEEIAQKLDIPLGTIKTRIRTAIKKLRKLL